MSRPCSKMQRGRRTEQSGNGVYALVCLCGSQCLRGDCFFAPDFTTKTRRSHRVTRSLGSARAALCRFLLFSVCLFPLAFASVVSAQDYSKFLHSSQKHASLSCNDCHRRTDNSARPSFPGHKACTGCHLGQFTTPTLPMCSICHQNVNGSDPPRKAFPDRFNENFNVKFDHAQHMTGAARPRNGCMSCHSGSLRRGAGLSIPVGLSAHNGCYSCHTPNSQANGRDLASCSVCHDQKSYSRTSTNAIAYSYAFRHADHSTRQRLNCSECHSYTRGLPQKRQVSSTRAQEHFPTGNNTCASCHNGRRSFGGDLDFKGCRRCHTGSTFRMG